MEAGIGLHDDVVLHGKRDIVRHAGQREGAGDIHVSAALAVDQAGIVAADSGLRLNREDEVVAVQLGIHALDLERAAAGVGELVKRDRLHLIREHGGLAVHGVDLTGVGIGLVPVHLPGDRVRAVERADLGIGKRECEGDGLRRVHRDERRLPGIQRHGGSLQRCRSIRREGEHAQHHGEHEDEDEHLYERLFLHNDTPPKHANLKYLLSKARYAAKVKRINAYFLRNF